MLDCIIREVGNYMDGICFILANDCVLWGLKLEPRTMSSSTLAIVSCTHIDPNPSHSESLGGRSLLNLRRDSECMHKFYSRKTPLRTTLGF
jgi:hypothetical protein